MNDHVRVDQLSWNAVEREEVLVRAAQQWVVDRGLTDVPALRSECLTARAAFRAGFELARSLVTAGAPIHLTDTELEIRGEQEREVLVSEAEHGLADEDGRR